MQPSDAGLKDVRALTFDVFGTVVDWRSTIHRELIESARNKIASPAFGNLPAPLQTRFQSISDDQWGIFAQEWRDSYGEFTQGFVPGETEWKDIDTHHYDSLAELLRKWDVVGVYTYEETRSLSLTWHYLRPWEDSALGIQKLGTRYITATLSNGNRSLLEDLNAHGSLNFKRIISTADFGAYKVRLPSYMSAPRPQPSLLILAWSLMQQTGNGMANLLLRSSRIQVHILARLVCSSAGPMR